MPRAELETHASESATSSTLADASRYSDEDRAKRLDRVSSSAAASTPVAKTSVAKITSIKTKPA